MVCNTTEDVHNKNTITSMIWTRERKKKEAYDATCELKLK